MGQSELLRTVEHGPVSQQSRVLSATVRRSWLPFVRTGRITPRGIRLLQRVTDPTRRVPVVRGTRVEPTRIGGRPAEWVRAPRALAQPAPADGGQPPMLLYLHGGGYIFGSPRTHRNLVSRISHVTGLPALVPDYRLPPADRLPAPMDDALAAYRELLDGGRDPARIVVAGDSAGGHLALTLALLAAEAGLPQPAGLVLLSPWTDMTMSGDSHVANDLTDVFIPPTSLERLTRYVARDLDPSDWRRSPLFAADELWRELPPTQVQVGSAERLRDDGARAARRIAAAGTRAELHVFDRQPHVPPLWSGTPEARTAVREIGRFTSSVLAPESAPAPPSAADAEAASEVVAPADLA